VDHHFHGFETWKVSSIGMQNRGRLSANLLGYPARDSDEFYQEV
jgi:hypothetical protein